MAPNKNAPVLAEVIHKIYEFCIHDHDEKEYTSYGLWKEVNNFFFGLDTVRYDVSEENKNSVWKLIDNLQNFDKPSKKLTKKEADLNLFTETDPAQWDRVKNWFTGKSRSMREPFLYVGSGYYAFVLLRRTECKEFIKYFYEALKIDGNANIIYDSASLLNWDEDLVLYATYILLGCNKGNDWIQSKLDLFNDFIEAKIAVTPAVSAEKTWLADVSDFRPRSIENTKCLSMQDFYVRPVFESQKMTCPEPLERLKGSNNSVRSLILGQTGIGKTMYMRMTALSLAQESLESIESDMYVIYIPAYMFSYCYQMTQYKDWTDDFVKLYINCMFRLSPSINFDKHEDRDRDYIIETDVSEYVLNDEFYEKLSDYFLVLAKLGKLVLIADSFDEIVSGEMRRAYLSALEKFSRHYCELPESSGAHIIISSRDMSQNTMESLASSINIKLSSSNVYRIMPLSVDQQEELILKWDKVFGNGIRDNINELKNHYFVELCANPYMLSVICNRPGKKINRITENLISNIISSREYKRNGMQDNELLLSVLDTHVITEILQNLALETVESSEPHFSDELLAKHFMARFTDLELSENEKDECYNLLVSLFTTDVGLIVPADNEDDRFQFISNQIRYELAASKIIKKASKSGSDAAVIQYCLTFVSNIQSDKEYISLIVPLICKTTNYSLQESLILHLALRTFDDDNHSLAIQAMIDLLLGRYGLNITLVEPDKSKAAYIHIINADRLIMMRLFSSPEFKPNDFEKKAISKSRAFEVCGDFLNEDQKKYLK